MMHMVRSLAFLLDLIQGVPVRAAFLFGDLFRPDLITQIGLALGTRAPILLRIPLSLTTAATLGSIPFILREHLSYSQLATFALSAYPYSLKLIWSPIVDAVYFPSVGRRKSWIIPMQTIIGSLMLWMSFTVQELMDNVCAFQPPFLSAQH
jgi:hypothetical protein